MEPVQEKDVDPRVDLAIERTELALERTQLAWVRTSLALLGSGVAIDQLLEVVHQMRAASVRALLERDHWPGLTLTAAGMLLMTVSSVQYRRRSRELKQMRGMQPNRFDTAMFSSLTTLVLGLGLFVALWLSNS